MSNSNLRSEMLNNSKIMTGKLNNSFLPLIKKERLDHKESMKQIKEIQHFRKNLDKKTRNTTI